MGEFGSRPNALQKRKEGEKVRNAKRKEIHSPRMD